MKVRALVVDDSGFFRRRIKSMLEEHPGIEVVGEAANGRQAVEQAQKLRPDVITMDIEMPEMDGITAVREIMRRQPTPVLMFSSLTYDGARETLDALDAGASDFIPKRFADISGDMEQVKRQLQERVLALGGGRGAPAGRAPRPAAPVDRGARSERARPAPGEASGRAPVPPTGARARPEAPVAPTGAPAAPAPERGQRIRPGALRLVVIGTSTGGPVALQRVMSRLPAGFPLPVLIIQHMPASFTPAFAERLNELCRIEVREAKNGDELRPGQALLAPGGRQAGVEERGGKLTVRIFDASSDQFYKPSVDIAFASAAKYCPGKALGVVLTGMGADGCEGAKLLKRTGAPIWSQDEATSVIYGMPAAVAKAGVTDRVLPLDQVGEELAKLR
ncbi:protein-glutamate methylesterase/protein-glutamine glutaminase [Alkalilimnicola ehrlichii MLHE-1]|uniref:Protein-glutamate methylesterase/protein-glutamine glutaminase n=1 Tax=Alkalilimnicola ehrlichii (strain ATCC BAA-1101 / DSM 17681 / MLHE-1) TaxID=187272 RepID=CHEB_ALKEH|nr:chemotaxis response regulator protein-glutamate methylesterase [Alkalilimnicola ehrlichii]Q0A9Z5.1 RecName: Full=Protein-glutamate methylesterase/protein-glutamine glutaminase [Alkalilimnicola ehrlichii MLHE-1]ABI56342.1 response regulator receiver modulated CheB methylesterase [Alkalilimnicola ehrlichii MLHE-1]